MQNFMEIVREQLQSKDISIEMCNVELTTFFRYRQLTLLNAKIKYGAQVTASNSAALEQTKILQARMNYKVILGRLDRTRISALV